MVELKIEHYLFFAFFICGLLVGMILVSLARPACAEEWKKIEAQAAENWVGCGNAVAMYDSSRCNATEMEKCTQTLRVIYGYCKNSTEAQNTWKNITGGENGSTLQ